MNVTLGTYKTTPEIKALVDIVLDSGRLSYGPMSKEYEKQFSAIHKARYGISSNSGTSSLVVAVQALKELYGWNDGDEVIVPALTFVASVNAILHNNLTPVLVDIDPRSYNIDVDKIEEKITSYTKAIMPVHLFGLMADVFGVWEIAESHDLRIIEDSCETILVNYLNRKPGELGDVACFSTYVAHHLVTGVGGMATTNNPLLADRMRSLINHGIDLSELPEGYTYEASYLSRKFTFTSIGHSFRITELEAAIGLAQLGALNHSIGRRTENAIYLRKRLFNLQEYLQLPTLEAGEVHSWMVFPIVLKNGSKWPVMRFLNEKDIECREMLPLTTQPCYSGLFNPLDYPVANNINERGFYIGIHQELTEDHLSYVAETLEEYFNQHGA